MKRLFIAQVAAQKRVGREIELLGWVSSKREHGGLVFLDLIDSSGKIQIITTEHSEPQVHQAARHIAPESCIKVTGRCKVGPSGTPEIEPSRIELLGPAALAVSPRPRSDFEIFAPKYADLVLKNRHLYIRNERLMAVLRFRDRLSRIIRSWFRRQGFVEIHAPVLTQLPLYDDKSAWPIDFFGQPVFLTQCVAFHLESAAAAFERVYSMGPSFRAEESRSRRHLAEYWHVKAEMAFASLEDIIKFTEKMLAFVLREAARRCETECKIFSTTPRPQLDRDALTPYPRISYDDAVKKLSVLGQDIPWGSSLGADELTKLSKEFRGPFWVTGFPVTTEPFPYETCPTDPRLTLTADLIAPGGYGEIVGVAEKISDGRKLLDRMVQKGKGDQERYRWYHELREYGSFPHSGLGMGIERLTAWLLGLNHVRDAIAFPRLFDRLPNP